MDFRHSNTLCDCVLAVMKLKPALSRSPWVAWNTSRLHLHTVRWSAEEHTLFYCVLFHFKADPLSQLVSVLLSLLIPTQPVLFVNSWWGKMKQMSTKTSHMTVRRALYAATQAPTYTVRSYFKAFPPHCFFSSRNPKSDKALSLDWRGFVFSSRHTSQTG